MKDTEAEKLFRIREAEETKNSLMQVASEHIAPLQDAVDLEIATEEERSLLEAWNKYRVLLNRVDTSVALGMKLFVTHVTVTVITISKVQNVY
ncbi:tail fiber assembly protein [Escherichia coli]|nr:tail fiber assembly protein [Escherichia coli]